MSRRSKKRRATKTKQASLKDRRAALKIGWYAHSRASRINCLCDGDALIIAGAKGRIEEICLRTPGRWQVASTTFEEIYSGLRRGGAYAFDQAAYGRFLPPAQVAGLELKDEDFSDPGPLGMHFVRVQITRPRPSGLLGF